MSELEVVLADAGGADAPPELSARLRELLFGELRRGRRELRLARTGYPDPIAVALAPGGGEVLAALPLERELRADADVVSERGALLAAAVVEKLVEATAPGPPASAADLRLLLGDLDGSLALTYPAPDPRYAVDYAREALDDLFDATDRLRCGAHVLPPHALAGIEDLRPPMGSTHPLRVAEAAVRHGVSPLDDEAMEALAPRLAELLEPSGSVARAHEDRDPARRVARRILQRLDGMGKWGGYHTEFEHLAHGFGKGNERALAKEVGEVLVGAGLLVEKTSVGQRHVSLNPRRSGDIRRLVDDGALPQGLRLPP
ncbi:MAG TPA: hypothetical protein VKB17_04665 [Thermoleophilaceae bacterium]|nr:hypothetical protein [Thermoleophilaceae bacterium]